MPASPKPPGDRVRRNRDQPNWRTLNAERTKAPKLPSRKPSWLKATREWWSLIWDSPMATAWLPSDVPVLLRLAALVEAINRGEFALLGEARQLEDRLGLTPKARLLLRWQVPSGVADEDRGEGGESGPSAPPSSGARGRLRAV